MKKADAARAFWTATTTIYIGGLLLYFVGRRPQDKFASEIIPVDEPTAVDWVTIGGILYFI